MAKVFTIVPDKANPGKYKFVFNINKGFLNVKDPALKLTTPVLTLSGTTLKINKVDHATSYKVFQNDIELGRIIATTSSYVTFELGDIIYPIQNGTIKAIAYDDANIYSTSDFGELASKYPPNKQTAPESSSATLTDATITITSSATGATKNVFNLEKNNQVISTIILPVSETTVNLNIACRNVSNDTYTVTMQAAIEGSAISDKITLGTYVRNLTLVALDQYVIPTAFRNVGAVEFKYDAEV